MKTYVCGDCDYPLIRLPDGKLQCTMCGAVTEPPVENRDCLLCGEPVSSDVDKQWYEASAYDTIRQGYFHSMCLQQWAEQIRLDKKQLEWEIDQYKLTKTIECPQCHELDTIILEPCATESNPVACLWMCHNCETVIPEEFMNQKFMEQGGKLLTCVRCGKPFSVCGGHDCTTPRLFLIK